MADSACSELAGVLSLARLEAQICELAGHLAAATCRFLLLVRDFDERRGWATWDLPSCAAWLSWKCQIAPGTAREHVRVARALRELPAIRAEFGAGRMSYAKVRALTRIAAPATDSDLAELAGPMTAAQVDRFAAAHRKVSSADDQDAQAHRRLSFRVDDDGQLAMTVRLPAADGAVVLQALRAAAGDIEHLHRNEVDDAPDQVRTGSPADEGTQAAVSPASLADALVDMAAALLAGKIAAAANPDIYQVIVHVGPEALTAPADQGGVPAGTPAACDDRPVGHPAHPERCHLEDGAAISPAAAQRIACSATVSWMLHDHDGNPLDVGRRHRTPPPALRRAVRERDGCRCQFPGCESRRTDIHHIVHWAKHGETKLHNLLLLCEAHHVIVHMLGYRIAPAAGGGFTFTRADGTVVPASPELPGGDGDLASWHGAAITGDTVIPAGLGDKLDLDLAIWACFANARVAAERREARQLAGDQLPIAA